VLRRAAAAAGEDPERPIHLEVPEDLPPVLADAERVHQVVANLLANSRKYSPNGGEVRLIARALDVAVQVEVVDRGLGIPPDALPHLFQRFYRVEAPDRSAIPGTGLGLAISKRIVEAHGGRMWAESSGPGEGTTMRFTLPLARSGSTAGDVLIVEDEAGFAHLLEAELSERGLSATRASCGEEALLEVAARPPRALLLDLGLPDISGEEFLRRLQEAGRADVPVLVVTMQDVDVEGRRILETLGARAVLSKGPGAAADAARAVAQLLSRRQKAS
jgi:CheY-like chemotaxis protein